MTTGSELRKDALGLVHAMAIGVAGTAPAYTIAASTAVLVAAVGALAPASLLYCGLIMAGITFAFVHLNRVDPDSGASYTWVGRVLHRDLGFLCVGRSQYGSWLDKGKHFTYNSYHRAAKEIP